MQEAKIMVKLDHPCIVKLIGVTTGNPIMLVPFSSYLPLNLTHRIWIVSTMIAQN